MKPSKSEEKESSKKTSKKVIRVQKPKQEPMGFLLPKNYKMWIQWRENPLYRGTFLLVLLTITWGAISAPRWIFSEEWKKASQDYKATSLAENQWVSDGLAKIRPLQNKYREIDEILKFRRIPLSPILSSLQKHIPKEVSINKIQWESNLKKTTKNIDITGRRLTQQPDADEIKNTFREAKLKLEVYATADWNRDRSPVGWLANVEKDIQSYGIRIANRTIGTEKPFIASGEIAQKMGKKGAGTTLEVTLSLELDGPQKTEQKSPAKPAPNLTLPKIPQKLPVKP